MRSLEKTAAAIALGPRSRDCEVPLAASQARYWRYVQDTGGRSFRLCGAALRIRGDLDVDLLRRCIEMLVHRHESLRTRIELTGERLTQQIEPPGEYSLDLVDLTGEPGEQRESHATQIAEAFIDDPVDLRAGPLFATKVLRLSASDHVLVVLMDHIISDIASCGVFNRELWALYEQGARGEPLYLPELAVQFADFAVWQHRTYPAWLEKHGPYWRDRLGGAPPLRIPPDHTVVEGQKPRGTAVHFPMGHGLSARLRELAQRKRTLLPLIVLTLYAPAIVKLCDENDLLIKFVSHGRYQRPELESMIGFLANSLHLRIILSKEDSFLSLLERIQTEFFAAYNHQDFDQAPCLVPECATEVFFNWLPAPAKGKRNDLELAAKAEMLRKQPFPVRSIRPIRFLPMFADSPAGIGVTVNYRSDLFSAITLERFGQNLRAIAEAFATNPDSSVIATLDGL